MNLNRHQINSVKKFSGMKRQQKKLFEPGFAGEFFFCSEMQENFKNLFAVLIFWYFSIKRKVHRGLFLKCIFFCHFSGACPELAEGSRKVIAQVNFKVRASFRSLLDRRKNILASLDYP